MLTPRLRDQAMTATERTELIRRLRLHGYTAAEASALCAGGRSRVSRISRRGDGQAKQNIPVGG